MSLKDLHVLRPKTINWIVFTVAGLALGLAWKPLVAFGWRTTHGKSITLGAAKVSVPYPWLLIKDGNPIMLQTFSTMWPTIAVDYATAVVKEAPAAQKIESAEAWFLGREENYRSSRYVNVKRELHKNGSVLCSKATKGTQNVAYCRSSGGKFVLAYSGSSEMPLSTIDVLP